MSYTLAAWSVRLFNPPHLWEAYRDYAANLTVRIFEKVAIHLNLRV